AGALAAAHGVDEDELALLAGAVLELLHALGGGELCEVGVELVDRRGLGDCARQAVKQYGKRRETRSRRSFHVAHLLRGASTPRKSRVRKNALQETGQGCVN